MTVATEAGKAAELICFALQPKIARGADERYGALWSDYRTSPFRFSLVDYQRGLDAKRRLLIGLVHLGIAAVS
jgi:hypothetical protein